MPGQRCAIYARFSTDRQNESSAEDQVRECRRYADRQGWDVVEVYTDLAISGANIRRPGMTAMLADAGNRCFDVILAEDQDRVARDLEDVSGIFKRLRHVDVGLFTIADGAVDWLKIGFKGTMDALELDKMKDKIRRGQRGCIARGRIPGGLAYGYDVVREFDERGQVDAGRRRINPDQAAVIVRICEQYAGGRGPKSIAHELNAEGVKSPGGGEWRAATIVGSRGRQNGILHNPIYIGRFVYNRVTMKRDPDSRNRVSRVNPEADRVVAELPELRIVSDELWQRVQEARSARAATPLVYRRRPRHLFAGLVRCGVCGGGMTNVADTRLGCTRAREAGTCSHRARLQLGDLQGRVLAGLEAQLLSAEAVALLVREYHLERERRAREDARASRVLGGRLRQAEAGVARLVAAIADGGGDFVDLRDALARKVEERDRARAELGELEAVPVIVLHPQIADVYRSRVGKIIAAIGAGEEISDQMKADIRGLVDAITVLPRPDGGHDIEFIGSLEAAIAMATGRPAPPRGIALAAMMVAEDRSQHRRQGRSIMV